MNEKKKEPLFHIVKRDAIPWYQSLGIRAVAIVLALILCAIITTVTTGINPIQVYQSIFAGCIWLCQKDLDYLPEHFHPASDFPALTPAFKRNFGILAVKVRCSTVVWHLQPA